jgi:hypothetical protein
MIFTLNHIPDLDLEFEMDFIPIHSRNESTIEFPITQTYLLPICPSSILLPPRPPFSSSGTPYNPTRPTKTKTKNKHNPKTAFKPRPTPSSASLTQGTKQYQLRKYAEQTLGSGNLRNAVVLPEGEEVCEWVAVHGESRAGSGRPSAGVFNVVEERFRGAGGLAGL